MMPPTQAIFRAVRLLDAAPAAAGLALLHWQSDDPAGRLVQVYLNGELCEVTDRTDERELWLHLDRSIANRVELIAVDPAERWLDYRDRLSAFDPRPTTTASLALRRDEALPIDTIVTVEVDGHCADRRPMWGAMDSRGGFGGLFGVGEFGRDEPAGPGIGLGAFGVGSFGADGRAWRWRDDRLPAGAHEIHATARDATGRVLATMTEPDTFTIDPLPTPATLIHETSPTGLTLRWNPADNT